MNRRLSSMPIVLAAAAGCAAALAGPAGAAAAPASGNKSSYGPDVSATGRYVVFASDATNLVAGDTNRKRDVFLRDTVARTTKLVSKGRAGAKSNGASYSATVSDDGRYVAFSSDATNLVAGDTNGKRDVFRADLQTGTIVRVSVSGTGAQGNGASDRGKISGTGSAIAFESAASNLVTKDTNRVTDIFVRDIPGGTRRVSLMPTGDQLSGASSQATISNNGRVVGFMGPSGSVGAIFEWSRGLGRTTVLDEDGSSWEVGSPVASNAGVSSAGAETELDCWSSFLGIVATPASASFTIYGGCSGDVDYDYDVSRTGAMATLSYFDYDVNAASLAVLDDEFAIEGQDSPPPRARKRVDASALSMSADGSRVGYATTVGGISQIQLWNWKAGTTTTVSTS